MKAFEAAKRASLERLAEIAASHVPLPWLYDRVQNARTTFGHDFRPYGIEPNRRTLEAFVQYAAEQGVAPRGRGRAVSDGSAVASARVMLVVDL